MTAVSDRIKSLVEEKDVVLFMKGTPTFPQCGFSSTVVQILCDIVKEMFETGELRDLLTEKGVQLSES